MKTAILCVLLGGAGIFAMAYQAGLFEEPAPQTEGLGEAPSPAAPAKKEPAPARAPFPAALAAACKGRPVAPAAEYKSGKGPHLLVFMTTAGQLHQWQENMNEDWQAPTVEKTELVVVLGKQRRSTIEIVPFQVGPPVHRQKYELDVSVVAAKTGQVLANKRFITMPREIMKIEEYRLTALGEPVPLSSVFAWVSRQAQAGFPPEFSSVHTEIINHQ